VKEIRGASPFFRDKRDIGDIKDIRKRAKKSGPEK
jgi:hypothetical protein